MGRRSEDDRAHASVAWGLLLCVVAACLGPVVGPRISPVLGLWAGAPFVLSAQDLHGTVIRADRTPLPDALVRVRVEGGAEVARAVSDGSGRFRLTLGDVEGIDLRLEATALGYADWTTAPFALEADADLEILVRMQVSAIPLDPVTVEASSLADLRLMADFERRRRNPAFGGHFITAEEIERRPMSRPSNLVLAAPGMTVRGGTGPFDRYTIFSGDCPAAVFVDGVRIEQTRRSVDDYLTLERIGGVEVYPRSLQAPPQYQDALARECGVVLFWTRDLQPDRDGGFSTTKIAVGVGLLAVLLGLGLIL